VSNKEGKAKLPPQSVNKKGKGKATLRAYTRGKGKLPLRV